MTMTCLIITVALYGLFRGCHEGIIHIQYPDNLLLDWNKDGVRNHQWFPAYHAIALFRDVLAIGLGMLIAKGGMPITTIVACLILLWECNEIAYGLARSFTIPFRHNGQAHEHFPFIDVDLKGWQVYLLHGVRIGVVITLLSGELT